jgi:hypothetical protein
MSASRSKADVFGGSGDVRFVPPEADIRKGTALYAKGANFCLVEVEEMTLSRPVRREYLSPVVAPANKGIS